MVKTLLSVISGKLLRFYQAYISLGESRLLLMFFCMTPSWIKSLRILKTECWQNWWERETGENPTEDA